MTWFTLGDAAWLRDFVSAAPDPVELTSIRVATYPDGEIRIDLTASPGDTAVIAVRLADPATGCFDMGLWWALLGAAQACRQHGCAKVVAIVPEVPCARQDRPTADSFELAARDWIGSLLASCGPDALITLHPKPDLEAAAGPCRIAAPPLREVARVVVHSLGELGAAIDVVVAPDKGSALFGSEFADLLSCPLETLSKHRVSTESVTMSAPLSLGRQRVSLIVDDMYVSGGTMLGAASLAAASGPFWCYVSHFRPTATGRERLRHLLALPGFGGLLIPAHHREKARGRIHPVGIASIVDPVVGQELGLVVDRRGAQ